MDQTRFVASPMYVRGAAGGATMPMHGPEVLRAS